MAVEIILLEDYENKRGVTKRAGTLLTFHHMDEEVEQMIADGVGQVKVGLPADMPGRDLFLKAGIDNLQHASGLKEWTDVKGIGPKTAQELDDYFLNSFSNTKNEGEQ